MSPGLRLAVLLLGLTLLQLLPPQLRGLTTIRGPGARVIVHVGVDCDPALLIDGILHCGAAAPATLAALCDDPRRPPRSLRSGDAVRRDPLCEAADPGPGDPSWGRMPPEELAALALPVDLNQASPEELASLPRIGPVLAARIVAARPFTSPEELLKIRGIGPKTLEGLRPRARTGEPPSAVTAGTSRGD